MGTLGVSAPEEIRPYAQGYSNCRSDLVLGIGKLLDFCGIRDDAREFAVDHLEDAVGVAAHAQVVGDHDAYTVLFVDELGEGFDDLEGKGGIETGSRFVGEDEFGIVNEGAGDGYALALAAGKLGGQVLESIAEAQTLEKLLGACFAGGIQTAVQAQHQLDVFLDIEKVDQIVGLEGEADLLTPEPCALGFAQIAQWFASEDDLAPVGGEQAGDHGQQAGFARSAGADEADEFTGIDGEGDFVDGHYDLVVKLVSLGQILGAQYFLHSFFIFPGTWRHGENIC